MINGAKTNIGPLRGWSPRGQRLRGQAPHGRWTTVTFLAALRHDRIDAPLGSRAAAPVLRTGSSALPMMVYDGPIDGNSFRVYVETVLAPTLAPGDVAIPPRACCARPLQGSDEAPAGASWTISAVTRGKPCARRSVPPAPSSSSSHLTALTSWRAALSTLIEQVFAKPKHLMRKAQERTVNALWRSIGSLLDAFPPDECARYLANAGYASM